MVKGKPLFHEVPDKDFCCEPSVRDTVQQSWSSDVNLVQQMEKGSGKNLAPFSLTGITKARPLSPDLWSVTVLYPTFIFKYLLSQYKPDRKTPLSLT